jgi:hypothetical protein
MDSQDLYNLLIQSPPPTKPPNWTRSRIRRQHFISLGIPINLDEVLPHANGRPLPPLQITTRPMSAPPGSRQTPINSRPPSTSNSRSGSPMPSANTRAQIPRAQFGPKPPLDEGKVIELIGLESCGLCYFTNRLALTQSSAAMSLQPLAVLERHLTEIRAQTASTSNLLTYLLQTRDALQQDAETYNGLIAELVGEAQKVKTGKGGKLPSRQNSKSVR